MKNAFLILPFLSILSLLPANGQHRKPNIVLILADDLGYGDVGCYGQTRIKTPHIDRLAANGMRFTQFYAGTTVCAPSRSALMTGQHTGHTYIRGNKEVQPEGQEPLAESVTTVAQVLSRAGYATGAFGKWGLGMVGTSGDPNRKGFDTFFGYNCQRQSHRYYPTHLWDNDKKVDLQGNDLRHKVTYAPELIQEKTLDFIEKHKERPFFLFVPTVLPHAELQGPEDAYYRMYESAFDEKPHKGNDYGPDATVGGYASIAKPRATFAGMVSRMDAYVGQIVEKLRVLGLLENTLILFSSDNGPHREGGADPDFFKSYGPFQGTKRDLYEGGIRVPFIASWKGKIPEASESGHIGAFWDLMPTFAALAGTRAPSDTDGISFLPAMLKKGRQRTHPYLYWEFHEGGGKQAVRMGRWKAIRLQAKGNPGAPVALYDLEKDPAETTDVAAAHPEVLKKAVKHMDEAHAESRLFPFFE